MDIDLPTLAVLGSTEQVEFVELAASLSPAEWSAPSLCTGMSVHDVVVHVAAHIHGDPSPRTMVRAVIRSGFSVSRTEKRLDRDVLARHGARTTEDLVGWLGQPIDGPESVTQVCELVIHQQDIRRAINRPRTIAPDLARLVLDYSLDDKRSKTVNYASKRVGGLRLTATDMAWSFGAGAEVRGEAEAILMAVNGRDQAIADLTGPGVAALADRTARWSARFADM